MAAPLTMETSMSQSEVFRPSNGPLMVRGNISHGIPQKTDAFRRTPTSRHGSRPHTQGGYTRFGQLSINSFFARHNPHPSRVRHLKGLLDVPICAVNDEGFVSNPRYSLNFPPNNFTDDKLKSYSKYYSMPVDCVNVNSQQHPINTITGLQWFMGKPLNLRFHREKAVPRMGLVPVTDAWRDELRALTEAVGLAPPNAKDVNVNVKAAERRVGTAPERRVGTAAERRTGTAESRPRTQYSERTGRLIPPPSRAMSRGFSRQGRTRDQAMEQLQHITGEQDSESVVLQMLCQILQTDDVNAVQSWLVAAGDREKALVLDMIRAAVSSNEEYYKQHPTEWVQDRPKTSPINGDNGDGFLPQDQSGQQDVDRAFDRLTIEDPSSPPALEPKEDETVVRYTYTPIGNRQTSPKPDGQCFDDLMKPPATADVFRPSKSRQSNRPRSGLSSSRPRSSTPGTPVDKMLNSEVRLRYTTTPIVDQDILSQRQSLKDVLGMDEQQQQQEEETTWQQDMSTVKK